MVGLLITWPSPARTRARLEGLGPRCNVRELAEGIAAGAAGLSAQPCGRQAAQSAIARSFAGHPGSGISPSEQMIGTGLDGFGLDDEIFGKPVRFRGGVGSCYIGVPDDDQIRYGLPFC